MLDWINERHSTYFESSNTITGHCCLIGFLLSNMVLLLLYLPPTLLSHRLNASFRPRRLSAFSFRMLEAMIILFLSLPPPLNFSLHLVVCSYLSQLSLPSFSPILSVLTLLSSSWLQFHECRQTMCYGAVYTLAEQVALKWVAQRSSISKKTKVLLKLTKVRLDAKVLHEFTLPL